MINIASSLGHILRPDQIKSGSEAQDLYPCPSHIQTSIQGVVYPENESDVQSIIKWAQAEKIALYPLSTGKNWGYGAGHPAMPDCLIVDMGRMNKILDFDTELGVIKIQPGVTQQQLYNFLQSKKASFYVPATGSSPDCSLIGNALERGYGISPTTDHFAGMASLRAVLPDGSIYQGPEWQRALGAGASNDLYSKGLFSQSNFGIVIEGTLVLVPIAQDHRIMIFGATRADQIKKFVDISREISVSNPNIVTSVKFFNLAYSVALNEEFPADLAAHDNFDMDRWIEDVAQKQNLPLWMSIVFVSGPTPILNKMVKKYKSILRPHVSNMMVFDRYLMTIIKILNMMLPRVGPFKKLSAKITSITNLYRLMLGQPQARFLRTAYWRAGTYPNDPKHSNPGKDGAGLIWFAPIIPFRGEDLLRFDQIIKNICKQFDIVPVVSITTISSRALSSLIPILFDPTTETEKAHACYTALFQACKNAGYLPYRGHVNALHQYADPDTSHYWDASQTLKKSIDPHMIMAPGRYDGMTRNKVVSFIKND